MTSASFHPFSCLPYELRAQIWSLTAVPRIVHLRTNRTDIASATPPPGVMQVSTESRRHAPYQKAFFVTTNIPSESRYIWVNFEADMISIEDHKLERLAHHHAEIQRLRFTITARYDDLIYEYFFRHSHEMMKPFTALQELHMVIEECILRWGNTFEHCFYACPKENVRFLEPNTGLLLGGLQLEMVYNWTSEKGGLVEDVDDFDEEMMLMIENQGGIHLDELHEIE